MDQTIYGRTLMGDSLGFHIIFALLGVGIPLLVSLFELLGIIKKDQDFLNVARKWTYVLTVLFIIGAVSGTIISIQLSVLWPVFMAFAGKVIGLPFSMETYAFFVEAIFLGIYAYSWKRFKNKYIHWLCSIPIVIGSVASAFFITTANAFMNAPAGFTLKNGVLSNIDPIKAMFNPATPTETLHSIFSYYLTTFLIFAGMYAWFLIKNKENILYNKKILNILMILSFIFVILTTLSGDSSAKYLVKYEPLKLAAAESLFKTQAFAPLEIGGIIKGNSLIDAIKIPDLLSFLAHENFSQSVLGLNQFSPLLWPPLWIHYMFDSMVVIGIIIFLIPLIFLIFWKFKKSFAYSRVMLILIFISGILSLLAVECGWVLTEVGRQPYIIKGIMKTADAFTTSKQVIEFGFLFPTLYLVLFAVTIFILRKHKYE